MNKLKIGILGGSFNPIHERHIEMGLAAIKEKELDQLIFLPTGNPPHKREGLAEAEHRYRMVRLATFGLKNCTVSHMELDREGIIYTADTLKLLHEKEPKASLHYIIGEDTLNDLPNWHDQDVVFSLCKFIVCCRSSQSLKNAEIIKRLEKEGAQFSFLTLPPAEVSATQIRGELEKGLEPKFLPLQVLEYIRIFGLYHTVPSPRGLSACYDRLSSVLTEKRLVHSLLVCNTARNLARIHGLSEEKAATAALLHDCAKCIPLESMRKLVENEDLNLDEAILESGNLLHGPAGASMAKSSFGVTDDEILNAIAYHTTGRPRMTELDMIIYLADKIEPSRKSYPALEAIRAAAQVSLAHATYLSLHSSTEYVKNSQNKLHPLSLETLNWLANMPVNQKG